MARFVLASLALLALSGGTACASATHGHHLGRALAEAVAQAPAPATAATPTTSPAPAAAGSTIITAVSAALAGGKLVLKHTSPVATADTPGVGALPSSLAKIVAASQAGEPAFAVLSSASGGGPDGSQPTVAVLQVSDPVLEGDTLTMAASYVPAGSAAPPAGGAAAAALRLPSAGGTAPATLDADLVSLAVDNAAAPAPTPPSAEPGQKSLIGAAVGAGIGSYACGTLCAVGGAAIGSSVGGGYYNGYYQPVVYYG